MTRGILGFTVSVVIATLASILWLGPYWFILIAGLVCGLWILVSCLVAAGRADRDLERMAWEHKNRGEPPRGGRDKAA